MKKIQLARAFRDEDYYLSLTEEERAGLPAHPSEMAVIDPQDLRQVAAAAFSAQCTNLGSTVACTPCPNRHCVA